MQEPAKQKLLAQIAIAAAWVDQRLEQAEIDYLKAIFIPQNLMDEAELLQMLQEPTSTLQLEAWLVQYLRWSNELERQQMLATLANLFIADGNVSSREHDFLDEFYALMAQVPPQPESLSQNLLGQLTRSISQMVKQLLDPAQRSASQT